MVIVALTVWSHSSIELHKKTWDFFMYPKFWSEGKADGSWEKDNNKAIIAIK
jgi:hypothetical protein